MVLHAATAANTAAAAAATAAAAAVTSASVVGLSEEDAVIDTAVTVIAALLSEFLTKSSHQSEMQKKNRKFRCCSNGHPSCSSSC